MDQNTQTEKTKVQNAIEELVAFLAAKVAECDDRTEAIRAQREELRKDLDEARKALAAVSGKTKKTRHVKRITKEQTKNKETK